MSAYATPEESFTARVAWDGEHLIWTGSTAYRGYGRMKVSGRLVPAHRFAWTRDHGPIPDDLWIDHMCHTPACVYVPHLRLATPAQNAANRSGANSGRDLPRGVTRRGDRYAVQIRHDGRRHWIGTFPTVEEASLAASNYRSIVFGEYAGNA